MLVYKCQSPLCLFLAKIRPSSGSTSCLWAHVTTDKCIAVQEANFKLAPKRKTDEEQLDADEIKVLGVLIPGLPYSVMFLILFLMYVVFECVHPNPIEFKCLNFLMRLSRCLSLSVWLSYNLSLSLSLSLSI